MPPKGRDGHDLETYEALSMVLQACGRAIRRRRTGRRVLLDARYLDGRVRRMLPPDLKFTEGDPAELLSEFFGTTQENVWKLQQEGERIITALTSLRREGHQERGGGGDPPGRVHGTGRAGQEQVPKSYRHPALDQSLRAHRTRMEARLLQEARSCGVPTPIIYDIDTVNAEIWMQEIVGPRAKDALMRAGPDEVRAISQEIGRMVALLHSHGMTHGDLTTSNMNSERQGVLHRPFAREQGSQPGEKGVDLHLLRKPSSPPTLT